MKRGLKFVISVLVILVLGSFFSNITSADVFNIGEEVDSDMDHIIFSSGTILEQPWRTYNVTEIFDGNLNTGINYTNSSIVELSYEIHFPNPIHIVNITMKPFFHGGNASRFMIDLRFNNLRFYFNNSGTDEMHLNVNCSINKLQLWIYPDASDHFYFNDVIINYTPTITDIRNILNDLDSLKTTVILLQNQINKINTTTYNINQTQQQIINDITNLWAFYNELNDTINYLEQDIININSSLYQNITRIESNLMVIQNDITKIEKMVNNVTLETENITVLQEQLEITKVDITNLSVNFTQLYDSIPDAYDDSALQARILTLENENAELKTKNQNLTTEINNLNSDISDLTTELDTLKQKVDDIEEKDDDEDHEHDEDGDDDEMLSVLAYGGIGFGIIGIIIALVAVGVAMRKKGAEGTSGEGEEEE